ncbi:MAG: hypothetical protein ABI685_11100 [Ferruginibacter sp.]
MQEYKISFWRNLRFASWTLLWASLLSFLIFFQPIDNGIAILCFLYLLILPGILIHLRYYFEDRNKVLQFGKDYIEVILADRSYRIRYTDINIVEHHYNYWEFKNPWGKYGYIKILLNDTTTFKYTCLLFDNLASLALFKAHNIPLKECEETIPW